MGNSLVHKLAAEGNVEILEAIFKVDVASNINRTRACDGRTPLHLLCKFAEVANGPADFAAKFAFLVQHGAKPWLEDNDGSTPYDLLINKPNAPVEVAQNVIALVDQLSRMTWSLLRENAKRTKLIEESYPQASNISLVVKEEGGDKTTTFLTNRFILATHSEKFRAEFQSTMKEGQASTIHITTDRTDAFSALIKYFHLGVVNDFMSNEQAIHLLQLADEYLCEDLKNTLENNFALWLDDSNAVAFFTAADKFRLSVLKSKAKNLIVECFDQVCDTEEFLEMMVKEPELIKEIMREKAERGRKRRREEEVHSGYSSSSDDR
eukprot:TRINITY_DN4202_c0_g1_i2.p1 TRINITY_DN4202_c0_g1~~TRINITY_DN4202_c0_g1_i2.p1  ORF type:complete len:322 (-),score=97.52 TRINITY_DN4202_c0_g1_i2:20-985(-)